MERPLEIPHEIQTLGSRLGFEFDPSKIDINKVIEVVQLVWQLIQVIGPIFFSADGSNPPNRPRGLTAQDWHKQLAAGVAKAQAEALLASLEHIKACGVTDPQGE